MRVLSLGVAPSCVRTAANPPRNSEGLAPGGASLDRLGTPRAGRTSGTIAGRIRVGNGLQALPGPWRGSRVRDGNDPAGRTALAFGGTRVSQVRCFAAPSRSAQRGWLVVGVAAAFVCGAAAVWTAEQTAPELARAIQRRYDNVRDFSADFVHSYEGGVLRRPLVERGHLLVRKPGRMRWEYRAPNEKLFVSDGTKLYAYIPQDRQVTVSAVPSQDEATTSALFLAGKGDLDPRFHAKSRRTAGRPASRHTGAEAGPEGPSAGVRVAGPRGRPDIARHPRPRHGGRAGRNIDLLLYKSAGKRRIDR